MRLVLDTNVVVSALLWGGTPEHLIALAGAGALEFVTSHALLAELERLLSRPKLAAQLGRKGLTAQEVLARYVELAQVIDASPIEEARLRDPDCVFHAFRAGIPRDNEQPFHGISSTQSRAFRTGCRRVATRGVLSLLRALGGGQFLLGLTH